jgi:hypothetical protein
MLIPSHYLLPTALGSGVSDVEQTEDRTILQSSSRFREHKAATSGEAGSDLEHQINRLREMLTVDHTREMTSAYLIELQAAVEAVGRAIKEERWAREGYSEFLGE